MADYPVQSLPSYLETTGWVLERGDESRQIWRHQAGATAYVPLEVGSDYSDLTDLATRSIAEVEDRNVEDVAVDLSYMGYDKMHVRRETHEFGLRLEDGLEFHRAVHDTVLAAALADRARGSAFSGRRPVSVIDYLDRVRLIPSIQGSFVVRALLPLTPEDEQLEFPLIGDAANNIPRISARIVSASEAAVQAAQSIAAGGDLGVWDASIASGVSANLCEALARLPSSSEDEGGDAEITVRWTWAAQPVAPPPVVRVSHRIAPVLAAGGDYLRTHEESLEIVLIGLVVGLHRQRPTGAGAVTTRGHVEAWDADRSLRFELDEQRYHEAVTAHDQGRTVIVRAQVRRLPSKPLEVLQVVSFTTASAT
jgi:hypothetical protein